GSPTVRAHAAGDLHPGAHRRGADQPGDRRQAVPGGEDDQGLRLQPPGEDGRPPPSGCRRPPGATPRRRGTGVPSLRLVRSPLTPPAGTGRPESLPTPAPPPAGGSRSARSDPGAPEPGSASTPATEP